MKGRRRPQRVRAGLDTVRYSGTPLPYSFSETHPKSITVVDMAADGTCVVDEVRVPASNLLGPPEGGFGVLMSELPQERLAIGLQSMAQAQRAYDITVDYVREREAFGSRIAEFQNTRFRLADLFLDTLSHDELPADATDQHGKAGIWSVPGRRRGCARASRPGPRPRAPGRRRPRRMPTWRRPARGNSSSRCARGT